MCCGRTGSGRPRLKPGASSCLVGTDVCRPSPGASRPLRSQRVNVVGGMASEGSRMMHEVRPHAPSASDPRAMIQSNGDDASKEGQSLNKRGALSPTRPLHGAPLLSQSTQRCRWRWGADKLCVSPSRTRSTSPLLSELRNHGTPFAPCIGEPSAYVGQVPLQRSPLLSPVSRRVESCSVRFVCGVVGCPSPRGPGSGLVAAHAGSGSGPASWSSGKSDSKIRSCT